MRDNRRSPSPHSSSNEEEPECAGSQRACTTSPCSFLKKLWKIVTSPHFQSVWWGDNGNCVVIAENFFEKGVLRKKGPHRIFEIECMADFIAQLTLHGFQKMEEDSSISVSIEELQAITAAGQTLGKLHFFYSPFFQRDQPDLLRMCKESPGERERAQAAAPRSPKQGGKRTKKTRGVVLAATGGAEEENGPQTCAASNITATNPWADPSTSAGPAPAKRHRSHSPDGIHDTAQDPSMNSPPCCTRPTSADADPPQLPALWLRSFPWLDGRTDGLQCRAAKRARDGPTAPCTPPMPQPLHGQDTAGVKEENDLQSRATPRGTASEPWADPDAPSTSAGPAPAKRRRRNSPDGVQEVALARPSPPPQRRSPPAPLFIGPPPRPDWWPNPAAGQAPRNGLIPFHPPELARDGPPAPGAAPWPTPPRRPAPIFRHCPTCSCPPNPRAAGQGDGC